MPEKPASQASLPGRTLKVCYLGTYRSEYTSNQEMIARLRLAGVDVFECHASLWQGEADRLWVARAGWLSPKFWLRLMRAYRQVLHRYRAIGDYDLMVVGYPGHLDVFLARILTRMRQKPLVWDVLMSLVMIARERRIDREHPFSVWMIQQLEKLACRLADGLIFDTFPYQEWFETQYSFASSHFLQIPLGADDRIFRPSVEYNPSQKKILNVVYHGSFVPNHGVQVILEAALLVQPGERIQFYLIGDGPEKGRALAKVQQLGLENVTFVPWQTTDELVRWLAKADICLGSFGDTPHALMTVQNKVFESLAMGKAVITGDSPAVRQFFSHKKEIYLIDRENPSALANAILHLADNEALRQRLAAGGYHAFQRDFSMEVLSRRMLNQLMELV